jgi:hypothetical protein
VASALAPPARDATSPLPGSCHSGPAHLAALAVFTRRGPFCYHGRVTQLPQIAPFHALALVRLITAELAEDDLSYGVEVDAVYAALVASRAAIDPCRAVLAMLVCGDFQTMPRLRCLP